MTRSRTQLATTWRAAAPFLLPLVLLLLGLGWYAYRAPLAVGDVTKDPTAVAGLPFYVGAVSTLGIMLWSLCVGACWVAARQASRGGDERSGRFLRFAALLSGLLAVDDAFLLHEVVGPTHLRVPGGVFLGLYAMAGVYLVSAWRSEIRRTDYGILLLALGLMGLSVGLDLLQDLGALAAVGFTSEGLEYLMEDGLKLLGITAWALYFVRTASRITPRTAGPTAS